MDSVFQVNYPEGPALSPIQGEGQVAGGLLGLIKRANLKNHPQSCWMDQMIGLHCTA